MKPFWIFALSSLTLAAAGFPNPTLAGAAGAGVRVVRCTIRSEGRTAFDGRCAFRPEGRDGSFSLSAVGGGRLMPDVSVVSVTIVEPGVAEVRGLTTSGVNSRWGEAQRSTKDRACWTGEDFEVCAR